MHKLPKIIQSILCSIAILLLFTNTAHASSLGVDPLFIEVSPGKASVIKIENSANFEIPVEILVHERMIDDQGRQTRRAADDDFIVFPPQAVIPAASIQNIRFQPIIENSAVSKSYYITVKQIPVELRTKSSGINLNVVFAFDAAVHIVPKKAKAEPVPISAKPSKLSLKNPNNPEDTTVVPAIAIELQNKGNKYLYLQDYKYEITGTDNQGNPVKIDHWNSDEIINSVPVVLVKPGARRVVKLPIEDHLDGADLSVKMTAR